MVHEVVRRRRRLRPEVAAALGPHRGRCGPRSRRSSSGRARTRPSSGRSTSCRAPSSRGSATSMRLLEPRFVSFARMLEDQPTFRTIVTVARKLVDAFAALHASGLCYRDISFSNLYVDPIRAEVADHRQRQRRPRRRRRLRQGDQPVHGARDRAGRGAALHRHRPVLARRLPLHPVRARPSAGGDAGDLRATRGHQADHVSEHELLLRNYGFEPLFVFDPDDDSNRPLARQPDARLLAHLSRGSSGTCSPDRSPRGSCDASLSGRVTGSVWRRGLLPGWPTSTPPARATPRSSSTPTSRSGRAGAAAEVPPAQPLLRLPGPDRGPLRGDGRSAPDHLRRDRADDECAWRWSRPTRASPAGSCCGTYGATWTVEPDDGGVPSRSAPSQRLGVRPMRIDFGSVAARIEVG